MHEKRTGESVRAATRLPGGGLRVIPGGPSRRSGGKLFEELALPVLDDLYRLCCRFEPDRQRAQDLLQEALLAGFRKFHQLREAAAFRAWMAAIVRHTHLNRRSSRTGDPLDGAALDPAAPQEAPSGPYEPERRLLARRLTRELKAALDRLPQDQRVAILLVDIQGFRYADAAQALGVAPGTVASRVARGRALLRRSLEHLARERGWAEP